MLYTDSANNNKLYAGQEIPAALKLTLIRAFSANMKQGPLALC